MATLEQILERSDLEVGYVLFLEGCPFAFTNREELVGDYTGFSWIGAVNGNREVLIGLDFPEHVGYSTNPETGMLESGDGATFTIQDFDNRIIEYVKYIDDPDTLGERLAPRDDPAPFDLIDAGGNNVQTWGRYVNHESIGQFGERNIFQLFPGDPLPGFDHAATASVTQTIAPSLVFDAPTALDGRRCALYRVYKDEELDSWPAWADQESSGYSRIWYGTVTSATARAKTWKFQCDGPSSWLRKPLNRNRPTEWMPAAVLPQGFSYFIGLEFRYTNGGTVENGASSFFDVPLDLLPSNSSAAEIIDFINARVQVLAATAGPDITYSVDHNAAAKISQISNRCYMQAKIDDNGFGYAAQWTLSMPLTIWRKLGFEPAVQSPKGGAPKTNLDILFFPQNDNDVLTGTFSQAIVPPGFGSEYWTAVVSTVPLGFSTPFEALFESDNGGKWRAYEAIAELGGVSLYPTQSVSQLQVLVSGVGPGPYLEGQTRRPLHHPVDVMNFPEDVVNPHDATGYFLLRGTYTPEDGEPITRVEVAKLSWHDNETSVGLDDQARQFFAIEEFLNPKFFGIRNGKDPTLWLYEGAQPWAVNDLEILPIAILGYADAYGDRADLTMLSMMLSTGTAYWTFYEFNNTAVRTLGANAHPDADFDQGSDTEIADLGLGIYHGLIDWGSFRATAKQLPGGGENSPLNRCKYAFIGAFDSQEVIARILAPRAWSMGFVNGQYRLYFRPQTLDLQNAEVLLGLDDYVEEGAGDVAIEMIDLNPLTPKDKFSISYGEPLTTDADREVDLEPFTCTAQDPSSRTRHTNAEVNIDGAGLIPFTLWNGAYANANWEAPWKELHGKTMASYYGAPYLKVKGLKVQHSKARDLGPGSIVRFESAFGPSRDGLYSLSSKVGRITAIKHNLKTLTADVDILIQPGSTHTLRRWAPIAKVLDLVDNVEDRYDAVSGKFYCYKDAFRHEGSDTLHDVAWFKEPAWLNVGGSALVHGWQWDGRSWAQTFSFEVANASTVDDSITAKGGITGTFYEAMETYLVMAPYDDQTMGSWPRAIFSVVTDSTFHFGAGPTKGFKLI